MSIPSNIPNNILEKFNTKTLSSQESWDLIVNLMIQNKNQKEELDKLKISSREAESKANERVKVAELRAVSKSSGGLTGLSVRAYNGLLRHSVATKTQVKEMIGNDYFDRFMIDGVGPATVKEIKLWAAA